MNMPGVTTAMAGNIGIGPPLQQHADDRSDDNVEMEDADHDLDDLSTSKPKKKRRVIKTSDKKYECPQPDCGKSYSRAEHLYRHQLNHTPKQIYHCDFPGCDRHFVRADLCARHKERHTAKGSHLQRKDAFMNSQRAAAAINSNSGPSLDLGTTTTMSQSPDEAHHGIQSVTQSDSYMQQPTAQSMQQPYTTSGTQYSSLTAMNGSSVMNTDNGTATVDPQLNVGSAYGATYTSNYNGQSSMMPPPSPTAGDRRYNLESQYDRTSSLTNGYTHHQQHLPMHPPPLSTPPTSNPMYSHQSYPSPSTTGQSLRSPSTGSFSTVSSLPHYGLSSGYTAPGAVRSSSALSPSVLASMDQYPVPNSRAGSIYDFNVVDQYAVGYTMPVFGNDGFNRSPQSALDDALFNQLLESGGMDLGNPPSPPIPEGMYNYQQPLSSLPKVELEGSTTTEQSADQSLWDSSSPNINGMDLSMRESSVSERKQGRIISLVRSFDDIGDMPGRKSKSEILAGDHNEANHPLSENMKKTYITSYWIHIHQQMPIMHRPTFNAETCPDLLLLAMFCLGACCLERTHSTEQIKNCSELSFFSAYHIRWQIFKDAEFRPTAKLWTFQTMLLLELFEKMYSTRPLHERAHIHHATTLTVMRRGSSLIGRNNTLDSPSGNPNGHDPTRTPPGPEGSINTSGQNTPDAFWNRWITAEATRRVAFAAFIIDSTHATLFGHSAVMSPHDLRLPLPCDEALWSATSSAEVQRVEASLAANGFKPVSFLEGLKKTLNGQKVRTNVFGRVILMAGLLNVSWHMNQRDLQVSSLGASHTLGNPTRWRSPLTRAFDFWRRDFDDSLSKNDHWLQVSNPENKSKCHVDHRDNVFESRTCLHSLAHMAMHVDIVDCEVFAGSGFALGRVVTESDRTAVQRRMREQWAPSARARDAVFYALRFLCEVLIPEYTTKPRDAQLQPASFAYNARDDYLLNRPWILYFACMIVWSYGYALEGPLRAPYALSTREQRVYDMQHYLARIGGVHSPDDLEGLKDRNSCLGMLFVLRDIFLQPRWELLHEASDMLQLCIGLLLQDGSDGKAAPAGAAVAGATPAL